MNRIIEMKNVSYAYEDSVETAEGQAIATNVLPTRIAVDGVSLEIFEGEFVALCGHNGSGKSTIAKLLNGLLQPTEGDITVFGKNTKDGDDLFDIRKNLGVVFQNPDNQMVASIIEDDIAFGPENIGLPSEEIVQRVEFALRAVDMYEFRKGTPFRLSGGQKQRIAIAGVLALMPRVIVFDESTSMLDPKGRAEVMAVMQKLNREQKITIIMITHYMEEALAADRVIIMNEGKIAFSGGKEVFDRETELTAMGLGLPFAVRVAKRLRESGINIDSEVDDIDGLVRCLCR